MYIARQLFEGAENLFKFQLRRDGRKDIKENKLKNDKKQKSEKKF